MTHHIIAFDEESPPSMSLREPGPEVVNDRLRFSCCGVEVECRPETTVAQLYMLVRRKLAQANDAA